MFAFWNLQVYVYSYRIDQLCTWNWCWNPKLVLSRESWMIRLIPPSCLWKFEAWAEVDLDKQREAWLTSALKNKPCGNLLALRQYAASFFFLSAFTLRQLLIIEQRKTSSTNRVSGSIPIPYAKVSLGKKTLNPNIFPGFLIDMCLLRQNVLYVQFICTLHMVRTLKNSSSVYARNQSCWSNQEKWLCVSKLTL